MLYVWLLGLWHFLFFRLNVTKCHSTKHLTFILPFHDSMGINHRLRVITSAKEALLI